MKSMFLALVLVAAIDVALSGHRDLTCDDHSAFIAAINPAPDCTEFDSAIADCDGAATDCLNQMEPVTQVTVRRDDGDGGCTRQVCCSVVCGNVQKARCNTDSDSCSDCGEKCRKISKTVDLQVVCDDKDAAEVETIQYRFPRCCRCIQGLGNP